MRFQLVRPMQRKGSSNQYFIKRIPRELRDRLVGRKLSIPLGEDQITILITDKMEAIRFSLKASDPHTVKQRQADAAAYIETVFKAARENKPVSLTYRQVCALAGRLYRAWAADFENDNRLALVHTGEDWERDDELTPEELEAAFGSIVLELKGKEESSDEKLEEIVGPLVDRLLRDEAILEVDTQSRRMLLTEFVKALRQGMEARQRNAGGDWSPDPNSERFPEWQPPANALSPQAGANMQRKAVSLRGLVDAWWQEAEASGRSQSTYESYKKAVYALAEFLGHDDAARVTPENILEFKDALLGNEMGGKPLSVKTVKDSYISGLRSIFAWAVANRKVAANPATGIRIVPSRKPKVRDSWFSKQEMAAILSAASNIRKKPKEPLQKHALKRWVPWLCAYTGARLGEIVQLRKQDIRQLEGHWVVSITPEAGRVKDREHRDVPIHPHLIELGLLEFVRSAQDGHLFMWSGTGRAAWRSSKNRLTAFIRTVVSDRNIQPNHGWRHTFKTIGSEAGIQDKVLDAICGHAPKTIGQAYGGVTLKTKVEAIRRFPRLL
jgi:integrase